MRIGLRTVTNAIAALSMLFPVVAAAGPAPPADPTEFTVRLVVNGRSYPASAMATFPNLYAYVDLREPAVIHGYDSFAAFNRAHQPRISISSTSKVDFYENVNCGGDGFTLNSGQRVDDLKQKGRDCFIFFCTANWDNIISSMYLQDAWVVLYDLPLTNPDPNQQTIVFSGTGGLNLTNYWFEDRASAVAVG